jgi:hypothetical protein
MSSSSSNAHTSEIATFSEFAALILLAPHSVDCQEQHNADSLVTTHSAAVDAKHEGAAATAAAAAVAAATAAAAAAALLTSSSVLSAGLVNPSAEEGGRNHKQQGGSNVSHTRQHCSVSMESHVYQGDQVLQQLLCLPQALGPLP